VTSTSSTAQPVIAIDPVTPVAFSRGVSTVPVGAVLADGGITRTVTAIGAIVFPAPVAAIVIVAEAVPEDGSAACTSEAATTPEPLPEAGETCSHDALEVAVHVTVPAPFCVSRSGCEVVLVCGVPPIMPKLNAPRSAASVGSTGLVMVAVTATEGSLPSPLALYATTRKE
jgi:hypothetical protein